MIEQIPFIVWSLHLVCISVNPHYNTMYTSGAGVCTVVHSSCPLKLGDSLTHYHPLSGEQILSQSYTVYTIPHCSMYS